MNTKRNAIFTCSCRAVGSNLKVGRPCWCHIQPEVLFSYLIVAEGNSAAHSRGSGGMPPRKILKFSSTEIAIM